MTKDDFVKQVLVNPRNSIFKTAQEVYHAISIFEEEGMLPPFIDADIDPNKKEYYTFYYDQVAYNGYCSWEEDIEDAEEFEDEEEYDIWREKEDGSLSEGDILMTDGIED